MSLDPELVIAFFTLFILELVLGIDNVIFLSILASKLPKEQQARARNLGLTLAMLMRIVLLFFATWILTLTETLFTIGEIDFSWADLLFIGGGGFLLYKAVTEIHHKLEGDDEEDHEHDEVKAKVEVTFASVIMQMVLLDIVFSLDSVITAVGMVDVLWIIIVAVVASFGVMLFASKFIFAFVNKHPTVKMLALSFLMMVGAFLILEGLGVHVNKVVIYAAMLFALTVEALNLVAASRREKRRGTKNKPVTLRPEYPGTDEAAVIAAATTSNGGSVTLSSKPIVGDAPDGEGSGRGGLG